MFGLFKKKSKITAENQALLDAMPSSQIDHWVTIVDEMVIKVKEEDVSGKYDKADIKDYFKVSLGDYILHLFKTHENITIDNGFMVIMEIAFVGRQVILEGFEGDEWTEFVLGSLIDFAKAWHEDDTFVQNIVDKRQKETNDLMENFGWTPEEYKEEMGHGPFDRVRVTKKGKSLADAAKNMNFDDFLKD